MFLLEKSVAKSIYILGLISLSSLFMLSLFSINSKGVFKVNNDTLCLDSLDLHNLRQELIDLENTYKTTAIDMLNLYGCYFDSTGDATLDIVENTYVDLPTYNQIVDGISLIYKKGYDEGAATAQDTMILYFGGYELLVNNTQYGNSGGAYKQSVWLGGGPACLVENVDSNIFSKLRITGQFWAGSASGDYPGSGISSGYSEVYFIDTVTGEEVFRQGLVGRPFNTIIDLLSLDLSNPINVWWQGSAYTTSSGDAVGANWVKETYLTVRDDYEG